MNEISIYKFINKNYEGDCIEIMSKLPDESVNLILTDPPYNASSGGVNLPNNKTGGAYYKVNEDWDKLGKYSDYMEFTLKWIKEVNRVLSPNGSMMVCCSFHNIGEVIITLKKLNYKFINIITWKKKNPMPNITRRTLTHSTEFIVWFAKGKKWTFNYKDMKKYNNGKQLQDVWEFPVLQGPERIKNGNGKGRSAHPTQKPLALFIRLIEMASKENDIVLDPFVGSGTTSVACEELNRKWIGVDNNHKYIEMANKRVEEVRKKKIKYLTSFLRL
jgi:site-specific DNA-methyltransferase (adenine-specific)/modification methylase